MPLGALQVLLYLYDSRNRSGGFRTLRDMKEDLGLTPTIASRCIYYWKGSFLPLTVTIDASDRRGRLIGLSEAGVEFVEKLEGMLAGE